MARRLTDTARTLRANPTDAEKLLWCRLRNRQVADAKFVRQFPIGPFIADFACRSCRLIIEIDGSQHAESPSDQERTRLIEAYGFCVLRFWNDDVLSNIDGVLERVAQEIGLARNIGP